MIKTRLFFTLVAGVAGEDMLDEFLVGKRELDHGQSATMDVRRFVKTPGGGGHCHIWAI